MSYDQRYYRLDLIPKYRQAIIDIRLKSFISDYKIKKWPVDAVTILKQIKKEGFIDLDYVFVPDCSVRFDAEARYYGAKDCFIILINKNKARRYPFKFSSDRRLNFTLAHEFGHIFLDHLYISNDCKTTLQKIIEEEEANEFAGRLLMPENMILASNFVSQTKVAEQFNVSNQALWKRLNHLKRLDLLHSPVFNVCEVCSNKQISPAAEFCHICGEWIVEKNKGVITLFYDDGYELNDNSKALKCPICENEEMWEKGQHCRICGSVLINCCTQCDTLAEGNSRYCELCGEETTFYQAQYLSDWPTAKTKLEGRAENSPDEWTSLEFEEPSDDMPYVAEGDEVPF